MSCTKEEIERKRLAAIQKRQSKSSSPSKPKSTSLESFSISQSKIGPIKNFPNTSLNTFHPYSRREQENTVGVGKVVSGTVYLISHERFEVNPSEFCTPLINIFKSIPSRSYDAKSKLWNFSIDDYQELMSKIAPLAPHIVLGAIPAYVLKVLRDPTVNTNNVDLSPIEATLRHKLMPFQEEGIQLTDNLWMDKKFDKNRGMLHYSHYRIKTWQNKIHELLPSVPLMNIVTLTSGKDAQLVADKQTEVVIVSYKITSMHTDLLKSKKFGVVIIDESHYLKSHKAQCTVALGGITRACRRAVLLSGTPALSRPAELYTQLALIEPGFFQSYTEYGKRYCDGKQTTFGWDMSGQSNLTELQVVLQKRFLIRRTKEQVLTKLEGKTRETVLLDRSLLQFSKEDERGLSQMAEAYKATRNSEQQAALITFFSESARAKIPAICKYIRQLLQDESCGKFLVFAHHKNVVDAICMTLDEARVHYICITGSTPSHSRADLVDKFQYADSCRCAVLSITAANSGITLTAANLVLFAELHWNPGILTQAESRAHRLGQVGAVCVRYLIAEGTADDHIWPMLQGKLNVLNNVGLSRDTFEDTTTSHQEPNSGIKQYFSPNPCKKNKNDYIPGTNIRKDSVNNANQTTMGKEQIQIGKEQCSMGKEQIQIEKEQCSIGTEQIEIGNEKFDMNISEKEKSFLDDDDDDELLANIDL
ncbi:hypothetical protein K1T71_009586 [Dendrolimus kikuchii]|uniref:Uncharacterized protein n=1 Tax=Dendrolimus kikuchii TaxID=765133 RepID=A0ACC1CSE2_9NEOP|nr:hypothetical protein K1T71_009586 [Dendrolimus kikuchii]